MEDQKLVNVLQMQKELNEDSISMMKKEGKKGVISSDFIEGFTRALIGQNKQLKNRILCEQGKREFPF